MDQDLESQRRELIGRERELGVVERWLVRPSAPHVMFLHGERGSGKTSLWRRGTERAAAEGCLVLACRPGRAEAGMRFAALGDLLQGVAQEDLEAVPAPLRNALRAVLLEVRDVGDVGAAADTRPVSLGVLSLLRHLTATRPAVIAVDDVQWMDQATAEVFRFAFRRLDRDPVLVLGTYGTGFFGLEREPVLPLDDVEDRLTSSQLPPLSDEDMSWLLQRRSLEGWPRSLIREAVRLADGNPGLALELTRRSEGEGAEDPLALPGTLMRWIPAKLVDVSEPAMETLRAAAHLRYSSVHLLERVVGKTAVRGLDEAAPSGLVAVVDGQVRFLRPAIAAALRQRSDPEGRRAFHRRLSAAASDPTDRLRHLAFASSRPDERLAGTLEDTSRSVPARTGDAERACQLAELSLRLTDPASTEALARRRLLVGDWHLALGDHLLAARIFHDLAERLPAGRPERTRLLRRLAWLDLWTRGVVESQARLEQSLAEVAADDTQAALLRCDFAFVRFITGDREGSAAQSMKALQLSAEPDVVTRARSLTAAAGAAASLARWPDPRALEELRSRASAAEDDWFALDLAARSRVHDDDPSVLPPAGSDPTDSSAESAHWLAWLAEGKYWRELWGEAANLADRGLRLAGETGEWVAAVRLYHVTALIAADRGRLEQAREAAHQGIDAARRAGLAPLVALNRAVLGYVEHEEGSTTAALQAFEPVLDVELPGPEPGLLRLFPNAVEALIDAGRVDRARAYLANLDACQPTMPVRWLAASCARCHGLLAAAGGELDEAEGWHRRAIETERVAPRRLELGRHLLAAGVVQRRRRRRDEAADALERARTIFAALGAEVWRARAAAEIQRLSPRHVAATQALSATQQRIADLVARGSSNKEVALALSLSVYTVESHLKVIFRKLGVQSRTALAYRVAESRYGPDHRP